jgi:hypothetical protein
MVKHITLVELQARDYNEVGISKYALSGDCQRCGKHFSYSYVIKFMRNRKNKPQKKELWNTCGQCWLLINTVLSEEWMNKNKNAQLIAQNRPEQKKKNAEGVSKSWTKQRKKRASKFLKDRWKNDEEFKKKALYNISWTQFNDARYDINIQKSWGTGGLKGRYNNIVYESALELSFVLYCEDHNVKIKRYDLNSIPYLDENQKSRLYIPDFIINNDTIIEIKGYGLYYNKNYNRNICKIHAVKDFVKDKDLKFRLILEHDKIIKEYYKKARKLHHANKEKNNNSI